MSIFGVSRDIGVSRDTTKVIHSREYFIYKISTRYLHIYKHLQILLIIKYRPRGMKIFCRYFVDKL